MPEKLKQAGYKVRAVETVYSVVLQHNGFSNHMLRKLVLELVFEPNHEMLEASHITLLVA